MQLQQQSLAKAQSQPLSLYQSQSRTTPQACTHPLPQPHPTLLAPTLTVLKPPAYPQPPPLPQGLLPAQGQQQRAAGPLDVIPQKEMASDNPPGSCWPAACAHREYCPRRDTEKEREEKGVGGDQQAKKELAEGRSEMATLRKTRRTRSETQV